MEIFRAKADVLLDVTERYPLADRQRSALPSCFGLENTRLSSASSFVVKISQRHFDDVNVQVERCREASVPLAGRPREDRPRALPTSRRASFDL